MPNATIDIDQLSLYFKNGLESIRKLNEYRADREGVRRSVWTIRRSPNTAVAQINGIAMDLIDKSLVEVNPDFRALGDLFRKEITSWTHLKEEIRKVSSEDVIKGFLTLLDRILKDEAALVPINTSAATVGNFLKKIRVMKAARIFKSKLKDAA